MGCFLPVACSGTLLILSACATQPRPGDLKIQLNENPVKLQLNPLVGARDVTRYASRSVTKSFIEGQIRHKISESVDFSVETKVLHVDAANSVGTYLVSTLEKNGKAEMADFALPEPGDPIELVLTARAKVLRAGNMPPGTLFYVPPIALPDHDVKVGDTWPFEAEWMSLNSGLTLRMEIVSTLKSWRDCGAAGTCAEVEISGGVTVPGAATNVAESPSVRFTSEIRGRMLLSVNKGTVLFSIVRVDENVVTAKESSEASSCMLAYVSEPPTDGIKIKKGSENCDPQAAVPQF